MDAQPLDAFLDRHFAAPRGQCSTGERADGQHPVTPVPDDPVPRLPRQLSTGVLLALCALTLVPAARATEALAFAECHLEDSGGVRAVDAECATLTVPLDRRSPDGPSIDLAVVRVPSLRDVGRRGDAGEGVGDGGRSAFTLIQGGPGGSSIDLYLSLRGAFDALRRDRDLLIVDQRGTGRSAPLRCPASEYDFLLEVPAILELTRRETQRCLDSLDVDVRHFTTSEAVADLDAVRAAAGYEQLDVYGASYGTRVALHYLRRHRERVRTLVLDGVVPVDWTLGPTIARDAQASLDRLFARCAADEDCARAFPALDTAFEALHQRLREASETVSLRHPVTGERETIEFGAAQLALAIRMLSYQPETRALIPLLVSRAEGGDLAPLAAQALLVSSALEETLATGMHNSVMCTEDLPFVAADAGSASDGYLGRDVLEGMRTVCELWPRGTMDAELREPFVADVPALLLSGSEDPVTPEANARRAAEHLPASRLLTGEGQGHGLAPRGCMPRLLAEFVREADAASLDASCLDDLAPAPAFVSFSGPAP